MKTQKLRMLGTIALLAGLACSATNLSGAGRVGQRHLEITLDGAFWDDDIALDDGIGASVTFNQPLANNLDLSLGYSYLSSDFEGGGGDIESNGLFFAGTWFTPAANGKFYTRAMLGWVDADVFDDEAAWGLELGYELPLSQQATLTPYVSYTDLFESGVDGTFDFGAAVDIDIARQVSLILDVSLDDDSNFGASAGVVWRF